MKVIEVTEITGTPLLVREYLVTLECSDQDSVTEKYKCVINSELVPQLGQRHPQRPGAFVCERHVSQTPLSSKMSLIVRYQYTSSAATIKDIGPQDFMLSEEG